MSSPDPLADHVRSVASALQNGAKANRAGAVGALARLRRAPIDDPTADPSVYRIVFEGFPDRYRHGELATAEERAAHVALCLLAQHLQSQSQPMHRSITARRTDYGLGVALRRLAQAHGGAEPTSPVVRRFNALVTADHEAEIIHHLRSVISLLRTNSLAIDYGRLARDLADLFSRVPSRRQRVQLTWAREFSRQAPAENDDKTDSSIDQHPLEETL